ncbi:hypothetical protein QJQ45_001428 [Haematococcus lacustris]|nr:hypothetical protein QJQ45_001428 [Haematococcus lacustris]
MSVAGEQQPIGNQRLAPVQTPRAVVAAMRRSPALPIPRVLQSPVIGLAGASALQPQRKKRKAENTTAAATDGGSTDSPRSRPVSQWVEAQWEQRAGAQVACKHCPDYVRSSKNVSRLKQHLLECPAFLKSSAARAAAKLDSNLSTAVARLQQQHVAEQEQQQEVLDIQTEFNEFFMRFLVDNNLPLHLVENETTKAFFNKFIPHLKLPSRYELSGSLLIALYITVMMDVKQRVAEAPFVALTMDGWAKSMGAAHLLGVCAVLAGRVSVFLDVINTAGHKILLLHAFKEHINQAKEVVQYFTHLSLPHELLRQQRAALAASHNLAAAAAAARADGTTVVGAVPAPKVELKQMSQTRFASLYDMLQSVQDNKQALRSVAWSGALGNDERSRAITAVLDCQDFWAKNEWLVGTLAPAAKLVEALQADAANLAHVHFGLMAVEGALDRTTRSCPPDFLDEAMELEQLWSDRMEYGHHDALYLAAALDPNFRDKHDTLTTDQLRAAEDLAARLASADGRGSDSAADQARYEFNTWCGGDYMTRMKLTPRFFSPLLLRDVVRWWGWYGKQTPVLMEVAQRVFCTPATSAGVERLFSVFKMLWSDKRNRLLMGRMWAMAYVFFNTRALKRDEQPFAPTAAEEEQWEEWMASQPVEAA